MAATVTRTGEHSLSDGRQGLAVRETYEVLLETPSAIGHLQAKNAPGLPYWGQRHPNHATLVVIDRNVRPRGEATGLYEVQITYGPPNLSRRDEDDTGDPTSRPWHTQWAWIACNEAVDTDIAGRPIVNSADEPIDPPPTREILDRLCTMRGTLPDTKATRDRLDDYNDTVNSNTVFGYPAGRGRMRTSYERMITSDGRQYLEVTVEIVFRLKLAAGTPDYCAWDRRILDQGYREKITSDGETVYRTIVGDDGQPVREPVPLDGSGGQLAEGANPVWLYYEEHERRNFGAIGLPTEAV
jgi:hypothetical protein